MGQAWPLEPGPSPGRPWARSLAWSRPGPRPGSKLMASLLEYHHKSLASWIQLVVCGACHLLPLHWACRVAESSLDRHMAASDELLDN